MRWQRSRGIRTTARFEPPGYLVAASSKPFSRTVTRQAENPDLFRRKRRNGAASGSVWGKMTFSAPPGCTTDSGFCRTATMPCVVARNRRPARVPAPADASSSSPADLKNPGARAQAMARSVFLSRRVMTMPQQYYGTFLLNN